MDVHSRRVRFIAKTQLTQLVVVGTDQRRDWLICRRLCRIHRRNVQNSLNFRFNYCYLPFRIHDEPLLAIESVIFNRPQEREDYGYSSMFRANCLCEFRDIGYVRRDRRCSIHPQKRTVVKSTGIQFVFRYNKKEDNEKIKQEKRNIR